MIESESAYVKACAFSEKKRNILHFVMRQEPVVFGITVTHCVILTCEDVPQQDIIWVQKKERTKEREKARKKENNEHSNKRMNKQKKEQTKKNEQKKEKKWTNI